MTISTASVTPALPQVHSVDAVANPASSVSHTVEPARELTALHAVAEALNGTGDLRGIMQTALEQVDNLLDISHGMAYRLVDSSREPDEPHLSLVAWRGVSASFLSQVSMLPLHGSLVAQAASTGQPLVWLVTEYPNARLRQLYLTEGIRRGITIPLLVQGRLVGALNLGTTREQAFSAAEQLLLSMFGQQASAAMTIVRLREAARQIASPAEPSRLARFLRDSVIQHLYSMTLYAETIARLLDSNDTVKAANYVQSLHATTLETLHELRLLFSELHPPELAQIGLVSALQARLRALTEWSGTEGDFSVEGGELVGLVPITVQKELYGIAQEALSNAIRHAHAHRIEMTLHFANGSTGLDVRDDGIGFEPDDSGHPTGFGLRTMRERAQRIGGTLDVTSAPGQGTQIHVTV